jgi:hypothetical protein
MSGLMERRATYVAPSFKVDLVPVVISVTLRVEVEWATNRS